MLGSNISYKAIEKWVSQNNPRHTWGVPYDLPTDLIVTQVLVPV